MYVENHPRRSRLPGQNTNPVYTLRQVCSNLICKVLPCELISCALLQVYTENDPGRPQISDADLVTVPPHIVARYIPTQTNMIAMLRTVANNAGRYRMPTWTLCCYTL